MKIRTSFVSNSSSSSFIVAFPSEPKSAEDVFQIMFNGKDGVIDYYSGPFSHKAIADQVWRDIQKPDYTTDYFDHDKEEWVHEDLGIDACAVSKMDDLYYYRNDKWDRQRGFYYHKCHPWWGSDKELLSQLTRLNEENTPSWDDIYSAKKEKDLGKPPPYAKPGETKKEYGYDPNKKWGIISERPWTDEEIRAYNDYEKRFSEWNQSDEVNTIRDRGQDLQERISRTEQLLAQKDWEAFKKWNPGFHFIVEYSDNDGAFYSTMEHGGIFDNVVHIRVSHH